MTIACPKIIKLSWGSIEIENHGVFKDVKLSPNCSIEWNWQETGTKHFPGIQYSDVEELINNQCEVISLSRGVLGRLNVSKELIGKLDSKGLEVHVQKTNKAVKLYNELIKTRKVGALIHTTC